MNLGRYFLPSLSAVIAALFLLTLVPACGGGPGLDQNGEPKDGVGKDGDKGSPKTPPPPQDAPLSAHMKAYLAKYPVDFGDYAASLDFLVNPDTALISDEQCQRSFGKDNEAFFKLNVQSTGRSDEANFREYFGGQVLTALGIATSRICFYGQARGNSTFANLYLSMADYNVGFRPILADKNKVTPKKGVNLNDPDVTKDPKVNVDTFVKVMPTYFLVSYNNLHKWLVGETDYANVDFLSYLVPKSSWFNYLAFDFEHAGLEKKAIDERLPNLTAIFADLSTEQKFSFVQQMREFIGDAEGSIDNPTKDSVLGRIFFSTRNTYAGGKVNFDELRNSMHQNIHGQIKTLIVAMEKMFADDGLSDSYQGYGERELLRQTIIDKAHAQMDGPTKALLRLSLLQDDSYVASANSKDQLVTLAGDDDAIKAFAEQESDNLTGVTQLQGDVKATVAKSKAELFSPADKVVKIVYDTGHVIAEVTDDTMALIENAFNEGGFTVTKTDLKGMNDSDIGGVVDEAITDEAILFFVGHTSSLPNLDDVWKSSKSIDNHYRAKKSLLPKILVNVVRKKSDTDTANYPVVSYYQGADGKAVSALFINEDSDEAMNKGGYAVVDVLLNKANDKNIIEDKSKLEQLISYLKDRYIK